ncbi:MAG: ATP-binding protein [Ignavibacteriaceae bacterium]
MKNYNKKENHILSIFIRVCGLLAAFLGFSAILGWTFNIPQLASFDPGKIPMALSTALLFVLYGLAIFFHNRLPSNRFVYRLGIASSFAGILIALLLFFLSLNGIYLDVEHLGIKMSGTVGGLVLGHMSPVTAFCFVFVGLSYLILMISTGRKKQAIFALILAVLVILLSIILFLSYLFGTPLFYKGNFIPPALSTSLAFLFLGIALLFISGLEVWTYERISDALFARSSYILVLIFTVLIASIVTAGYSYYKNYEKNYKAGIENQLSAIASLKVGELVEWRKERLGDASFYYKNINFSQLVKRFFENPNNTDIKTRIHVWLKQARDAFYLNRICLYDAKGNEQFIFPDTLGPHSSNFLKSISEVMESGKITFTDFYRNEYDKRIYLELFVPILDTDDNNKVIGVLTMRINPEEYLYPLIKKWPTPSKTAETIIIRRDGNNVLFLNELRFEKNTVLNLRRPLTNERMPVAKEVLGKEGIVEGVSYSGVPVIAFVRVIPNSPWFLVVRMDLSEVYAPLRGEFWLVTILIAGLLIGAGAGVGLVWRQQRVQFYKDRYSDVERIKKLNRIYAVLSNVNQAIVRIHDLNKLLNESCTIAVRDGKLIMAWIGMVDPQTNKVNPVASAGFTDNYLKTINIDLSDEKLSQGPTGRAIKSGIHYIANDINNNAEMIPWRENALRHGYKSSAAFPIKVFGKTLGAFMLYASEQFFFDEDEIKLLDEMAMDISFALEFMEREAERKRTEEELLKLSRAVEQSPASVVITNSEGNIEYVNQKFCEITGFSKGEVIGKNQRIWKSDHQDKKLYEYLWNTILSGKDWKGEILNKKKNGELFWESELISPLVNKEGDITHFVAIKEDITEKKNLISDLIIAKEKVELANKLKDAFIANISHEIRTPLNGILGMASLIKESFHNYITNEEEGYFSDIDIASKRIIRTVDLILNFSRLQIGEYETNFKSLNLDSLISGLIKQFKYTIYNKPLELTYENKCGEVNIFADDYSITQAISNLIDNAIKYTPKGFVKVVLYKEVVDKITLDIIDSGIGISENYIGHIFEPYTQEVVGYSRPYEGIGLGLSLVKKFIDLNGASISVKSKKGKGTTFTILLKI